MIVFRCFLLLAMFCARQGLSQDITDLFQAVEQGDASAVVNFFDKINTINLDKAYTLISNIYDYYLDQFGPEILNNEEFLKNLDCCRKFYHSIFHQNQLSLEYSLIKNSNDKRKNNRKNEDAEIPGSMTLGGVEILTGALIWILPFPAAKQLGGIMIGDGVRRTFNGIEEIDENKKKSLSPSDSPKE